MIQACHRRATSRRRMPRLAFLALLVPATLATAGILLSVPPAAHAQTADPYDAPYDSGLPSDFELGLEVTTALANTIGFVDNDAWLERLSEIGYRVASLGGGQTHYSFAALDLPEPNAIALPGGFICVTRGILEMSLSDDELAHLLGHEISHLELGHHSRAARVNTLLSLARTALMVGVIMGAPNDNASRERVAVSDDPGRRDWAVGMTGKEALLQASTIFGGVVQTLFERGYSRKYEFEADDGGHRLATWAGYRPEAGIELLTQLHERSFEGNRYSYWRTHPYFEDRISRARVRTARHKGPASLPDDAAYRQRQALFFARAAERVHDEAQALQLFSRARWCAPERVASLEMGLNLARFWERREEKSQPFLRHYGTVIGAYDSLIVRAERADPQWPALTEARDERALLERQREELLSEYVGLLSSPDVPTQLLERFVENYPSHPRVTEARYLLGLHLSLAGRATEGIERLLAVAADSSAGAWRDSSLAAVRLVIPEIKDLSACYQLLESPLLQPSGASGVAIADAARARMDELVASDFTLEQGGRYLAAHADSPWSETVRAKVAERAEQTYRAGRVQEGMQQYQEALDAYFEVLAFAGDAPTATNAAESIERINRLEEFE
jgi:predicted Zn-dependent protease